MNITMLFALRFMGVFHNFTQTQRTHAHSRTQTRGWNGEEENYDVLSSFRWSNGSGSSRVIKWRCPNTPRNNINRTLIRVWNRGTECVCCVSIGGEIEKRFMAKWIVLYTDEMKRREQKTRTRAREKEYHGKCKSCDFETGETRKEWAVSVHAFDTHRSVCTLT